MESVNVKDFRLCKLHVETDITNFIMAIYFEQMGSEMLEFYLEKCLIYLYHLNHVNFKALKIFKILFQFFEIKLKPLDKLCPKIFSIFAHAVHIYPRE